MIMNSLRWHRARSAPGASGCGTYPPLAVPPSSHPGGVGFSLDWVCSRQDGAGPRVCRRPGPVAEQTCCGADPFLPTATVQRDDDTPGFPISLRPVSADLTSSR